MRHELAHRLAMHLCQPRLCIESPNPLPKEHEHQNAQIVRKQHAAKDTSDDNSVPRLLNPIEQPLAKAEADELFADAHGDQRFGHVAVVAVDAVREGEGEVEVCSRERSVCGEEYRKVRKLTRRPVCHRHASEVAHPVQVSFCCEAIDDEAGGTDEHCWQEDAKAHFLSLVSACRY